MFQSPLGEACFYRVWWHGSRPRPRTWFQSPLGEACFYRSPASDLGALSAPRVSIPTRGSLLLQVEGQLAANVREPRFNPHSGKPAFTGRPEGRRPPRRHLVFQSPLGEACFYRHDHGGHEGDGGDQFQSPLGEACFYRAAAEALRALTASMFQSPLGEACFYRSTSPPPPSPVVMVSIPTRGSLLLQEVGPHDLPLGTGPVSIPTRGSLLLQGAAAGVAVATLVNVSIPTRGSLLLQGGRPPPPSRSGSSRFNPHSGKPAFTGPGCGRRGSNGGTSVSIPTRGSLLLQAADAGRGRGPPDSVSIPTRGSLLLQGG